jgi:hypothetical protein
MNELVPPDVAIGALVLAVVILYAAWHEYKAQNRRDASLLAAVGTVSLIGSAMAWVQ